MVPVATLGCVCFVYAWVKPTRGKPFPVFTGCFLGRMAHISQCKICITIKVPPPSISITFKKFVFSSVKEELTV